MFFLPRFGPERILELVGKDAQPHGFGFDQGGTAGEFPEQGRGESGDLKIVALPFDVIPGGSAAPASSERNSA